MQEVAAEPEAQATLRSVKGSVYKVRPADAHSGCTCAAPWCEAHAQILAFSSPLQVRRILDVIRGRDYQQAVMMLEFLPHRAAKIVRAF